MTKDVKPSTIKSDVAENEPPLVDEAQTREGAGSTDDPSGTSGSVPDDNRRKEGSKNIDIDITRRSD